VRAFLAGYTLGAAARMCCYRAVREVITQANSVGFRTRYTHWKEGGSCMNSSQKIIGAIVLLLVSTSAAFAQTDAKNLDSLSGRRRGVAENL
jgi:hypothetical protein